MNPVSFIAVSTVTLGIISSLLALCLIFRARLQACILRNAQAEEQWKFAHESVSNQLATCTNDKLELEKHLAEHTQHTQSAMDQLNQTLEAKQQRWMEAEIQVNVLQEKLRAAESQVKWFNDNEARMLEQFRHLTINVLEDQRVKSLSSSQEKMKHAIHPLETQLERFQNLLGQYFQMQQCDREVFVHELQKLQKLNLNLSEQADSLTNALRGDKKLQGMWGEMLLEKALEASGLRKESEYRLQVSLATDAQSGQRFQPDALVYLPNDRVVIIDSKLSLSAYERYANAKESSDQTQAIQAHIAAVRSHVKRLSEKSYFKSPEIKSLDYVLMFIPLEASFNLLVQRAPELLGEAQEHQVMLVGPSTLLVALKTIQSLWQVEKQQVYAKEISEKAAGLYDKFRLLLTSLQALGESLDKAQSEFAQTMNRLCQGKGNLLRQIEGFREMGVPVKKRLCEPQIHYKSGPERLVIAQSDPPYDLSEIEPPNPLVEPSPSC